MWQCLGVRFGAGPSGEHRFVEPVLVKGHLEIALETIEGVDGVVMNVVRIADKEVITSVHQDKARVTQPPAFIWGGNTRDGAH